MQNPRHIEFQVFGDGEGNLVHLFERDCSVQRRHQKVIEESPAPHYPEELRQRMAASAVAAAKGIGYVNAGTVEFIVTGDEHYFLEMNTRLQVEHPITELVVGTDLVRAQIDVASGGRLPWNQEDLRQRGHAMECRIYAEDPDQGFLPQTGMIERYREPAGPGIRVDSGVGEGTEVSVSFDPLLAKLICWAEDRKSCAERMRRALEEMVVLGTRTNIAYLRRVITHPQFLEGVYSTSFVERHADSLAREVVPEAGAVGLVLNSLNRKRAGAARAEAGSRIASIWDSAGDWGRGN